MISSISIKTLDHDKKSKLTQLIPQERKKENLFC